MSSGGGTYRASTTMGCKEVTTVPRNQQYSIAAHSELSYTETIDGHYGGLSQATQAAGRIPLRSGFNEVLVIG